MLDISTIKVAQIILFGHEIERCESEFRGFVNTLNEDECYSLVAIMWIGRESFAAEEFQEAVEIAEDAQAELDRLDR